MGSISKFTDGAGTSYDLAVDAANVGGTLAIANGGTGASTAADALTKLGAAASSHSHGYISSTGGLNGTDGSYTVRLTGERIVDSPAAKYLWHDILAFGRHVGWPTYYTTADGSNWTAATLSRVPFLEKDGTATTVINSTVLGSRWVWNSSNFAYCGASYLFLGIGYGGDSVKQTNVTLESSANGSSWTTRYSGSFAQHQRPFLFKTKEMSNHSYLRLTMVQNDLTATHANVVVQAIKFVTTRWGSQGSGVEKEYPYDWDDSCNILPIDNNTRNLGSSSLKWATVYATTFNGALTGNVTGNCSGSSGSCTGNATTATTATNYASTGGIATALAGKQATLTQGDNITISGTTISATDTTYSEPDDDTLQGIVDDLS